MIDELVIFGCSHSVLDWQKYLNSEIKCVCYAEGGSSNELILKKLKKYLNDNWDILQNKILIIQFTYLHRRHVFFDLTDKDYKLHGGNSIKNNYQFSEEHNKIVGDYYDSWLKYFYNGRYEFLNLLNELRLLKKIFELKKVKYIWYLWDDVELNEILFNEKNTNKIKIVNEIFEELSFTNFDNEYIVSEFIKKNKWRNSDISNTSDSHIAEIYKKEFVEIIKTKINNLEK